MQSLTIRQTYALWGGVRPTSFRSTAIKGYDVTAVAMQILPTLPPHARVASIHLRPLASCFAGRRPLAVSRKVIQARRELTDAGYTHIAVTGPFVSAITTRDRLTELVRCANEPVFAQVYVLFYRFILATFLLLPTNWRPRRRARLRALAASAAEGFRVHAVFAL